MKQIIELPLKSGWKEFTFDEKDKDKIINILTEYEEKS